MTTRAQRTWLATGFVFAAMAATVTAAEAQKKYGPGAERHRDQARSNDAL